jgi:vacuolar protein sorting-associated protein 45
VYVIAHSNAFYAIPVFTNSVRHVHLERIAEADEQEIIKDFQEFYCDFYPLNRQLFSFNEASLKLYEGVSSNQCFSRVIEGVASYFFASKRRPVIRYSQNSNDCTIFAKEINVK